MLSAPKGLEAPIAICRSTRSEPVWTDNGGSVSLCRQLSSWTKHSTKQLANPHFPNGVCQLAFFTTIKICTLSFVRVRMRNELSHDVNRMRVRGVCAGLPLS